MLVGVLDHIEGALEVDVDDRVKIALLHVEHQLVARDAGVVDQVINAAEVLDHLVDDLLGSGKVRDVAEILLHLGAVLLQLLFGVQALALVADVENGDIRAAFGELLGDRQTDSA